MVKNGDFKWKTKLRNKEDRIGQTAEKKLWMEYARKKGR